MTEVKLPKRNEIPDRYKWNAQSVFADQQAWDTEFDRIAKNLSILDQYRGHLGESPAMLADGFEAVEDILCRTMKVLVYAYMSHGVDTLDMAATGVLGKAQGLSGQVMAAVSFVEPELIGISQEKLKNWSKEESRLEKYAHYWDNLFRKQAHIRSSEVEEVLGMLMDPFSGVRTTVGMLTDADFKHKPALTRDGQELPVSEGTIDLLLASEDREVRRTAWENYSDTFLDHKNTLASNLATSIKQNVFNMRVRRHSSTLEASLFENNIPVEVFYSLIETYKKNLPTWHRYWRIRRKALGVDQLHPYDIWAPLTRENPEMTYEETVDWISKGLQPMGEEYVSVLRKGCLEQRWVDVFPNQGKSGGASSGGSPGTYPFILMSYDDTIFSLSTLAHELGHSMHSYLTWQNQPFVYGDYSLFIAEVASNFHQAMVRAYLLKNAPDKAFKISVIEEAMSNFHRYFFIMPALARFELEMHQRVEHGQGLTADEMNARMVDLFSEGYGGEMVVDRERVGITWATFGHLYADYYVYQYATGISAANALANRILSGVPGAVEDYLSFLKAGSSVYPIDALKMAGVDLTSPQPVEQTFQILSNLVDELESLLGT